MYCDVFTCDKGEMSSCINLQESVWSRIDRSEYIFVHYIVISCRMDLSSLVASHCFPMHETNELLETNEKLVRYFSLKDDFLIY